MTRAIVIRSLAIATAAGALFMAVGAALAASDRGSLAGIVSDASGAPVAGAFVKLRNAPRRLTFMVISQDHGRFEADDLPAGQYTVQGVGGAFESPVSAPVVVAVGAQSHADLKLSAARGPMLPPAWPQKLPEAQIPGMSLDLPAGEGKTLVAERCTVCHSVQRIEVQRQGIDQWTHAVAAMRTRMAIASVPDITDAEAATIATYLAEHFGPLQPYDANSRLPPTLLRGKAMHYRLVTYDLVDRFAEPHDVAVDPTGVAWVGERIGNKMGRFDPDTLELIEVAMPPGPAPADRESLGNPQIDARGILWVNDGPNARWLSYDTKTGKFLAFAWPRGQGGAGGNSMAIHPDGTIWATGVAKDVRMLDPRTGQFRFFESPTGRPASAPAPTVSRWPATARCGGPSRWST